VGFYKLSGRGLDGFPMSLGVFGQHDQLLINDNFNDSGNVEQSLHQAVVVCRDRATVMIVVG